ncbi:glycosyltransferase [Rhodothermus profundi]|uniref:Glycosyltransferase involved in cell wall bisynthesis n=1 Tax=Rhodothermus profundi TaxID=633813 RepID=A0A1M6QC77_9BACT|nr:glycosyltransferase [Rhodothermus profundi]SHK17889.1 Glycosyltransferase involved in cell wall bisynthesis [Rhodothermus profundi]
MRDDLKNQLLEGEELFVRGAYPQALQRFESVLEQEPDNPYALNDAGLAYAELGQLERAVACFERALQVDPGHENAFFNLIDQLLRYNQFELAVETFVRYQEAIPDSEQKRKYERDLAREVRRQWEATLNAQPGIYLGEPTEPGEQVCKVAFVCGPHTTFIVDIEKQLARRHHVRVYHFPKSVNWLQVQEALDWADVVWFEWCDSLLVEASHRLTKRAAVVCRLHSYEVFSELPQRVNWEFIDRLVFVAPHIKQLFEQYFPRIAYHVEKIVIPNGVDINRFQFKNRNPGFNLAYVGYINHKKNPSFLLQCIYRLVQRDKRYRLYVAGIHQERRFEVYWNHMIRELDLQDHVIMEGWVEDIETWLDDKNFIISTSVHEGCPYSVLEAASCGIKPVIHYFFGADKIFPREWLFRNIDEFLEAIYSDNYDSKKYRDWIVENFNQSDQIKAIDNLVLSLNREYASSNIKPVRDNNKMENKYDNKNRVILDKYGWINVAKWKDYLLGSKFDNGFRAIISHPNVAIIYRNELLKNIVKDRAILDVGCADHAPLIEQKLRQGGWLHAELARVARRCVGVDIDEEAIAVARQFGYTILQHNVLTDPVPEELQAEHWDYMILGEVLEHIGNPVQFLQQIHEKYAELVDRLILTVPNALKALNYQAAQQHQEIVNSDHRFWFTPYTLSKVVTDAGFQVERFCFAQGLGPMNDSTKRLLEQYPALRDHIVLIAAF